jgi:DNA-binding NtrC family response regulator
VSGNGVGDVRRRERFILSNVPDIALVLSDTVIAGGMSGYELGRRIQANRPEIRVVLTSGFAPEPTDASLESQFPVLRKPFSHAELSRALSHALYGPDAD